MSSQPYVTEVNRPGRTGRVVQICVIVGLLAVLPVLIYQALTPDEDDVRAAADAAAYELERTPVKGLGIYIFDVQEALSVGARDGRGRSYASRLRVRDAGSDSRGDLYEITNSGGDHPVCLILQVEVDLFSDAPAFPTATVTDGRC
jgi:hypothetical protein